MGYVFPPIKLLYLVWKGYRDNADDAVSSLLLKHAGQRLSMDSYEVCMAGKTQIGRKGASEELGRSESLMADRPRSGKREVDTRAQISLLGRRRAPHALILMFDLSLVSRLCQAGFRHGWSSRVLDVVQSRFVHSFPFDPNFNAKFISAFPLPPFS